MDRHREIPNCSAPDSDRVGHGRIRIQQTLLAALLMAGGTGLVTGCSTMPTMPQLPWSTSASSLPQLPDRMLAIWTDTTLHQPGLPAVRGFGGRVFFYLKDSPDPIQVDGALTVLAFGGEPGDRNQRPEKKFVFTVDQLPEHYAKCNLGHSYNLWIPWGPSTGSTRQIHLVARFEGRAGGILFSDGVTKFLPGTEPPASHPKRSANHPAHVSSGTPGPPTNGNGTVQPAGFQQADATPVEASPAAMRTHAIDLPPHFARRLAQPDSARSNGIRGPLTVPFSADPARATRPHRTVESTADSQRPKFPARSARQF